jgi:hypothetical protein
VEKRDTMLSLHSFCSDDWKYQCDTWETIPSIHSQAYLWLVTNHFGELGLIVDPYNHLDIIKLLKYGS